MDHFTEALNLSTLHPLHAGLRRPCRFSHGARRTRIAPRPSSSRMLSLTTKASAQTGKTRRAFWADRAANESALRKNLLSLETTRTRHVGDDPEPGAYDPDLWTDEFAFLNQPGQAEIQSDLFYDYRTNVEAYPKWQAWMQKISRGCW